MTNADSLSTKLTNEQLRNLLDAHLKEGITEQHREWIKRHRARVQQTKANLFNVEHLKSATDEELTRDLLEHYGSVVRVQMYRRSIEDNVDKLRVGLLYLLESKDSLQAKVDEILDKNGRCTVHGIGKAFWSTFLQVLDPSRNPHWNPKAEQALENLGMRNWKRGHSPGKIYLAVQKAQLALCALREDLDLFLVDHFMHYVTVMEGKATIDGWLDQVPKPRGERDVEGSLTETVARYWKIAPGENAWNWDACREGGFIAIGWDQLGDISDLSRSEFNGRRDDLLTQHDGWTKSGTDQVWKFARIREGDHIVANRGTTEVLGIGRVVGSYYFVEGQSHGHRLPVEWDDVARRRVEEGGWRRTLIELGREKFEDVSRAPEVDGPPTLPPPPERAFSGFSAQTFQFFADLSRNNNTVWFHENRAVFEHQVDNPLRALMEDVAKEPIIKLDPALETSISARTTISRINKNLFGRVEEGLYNEWYWGAFYRRERSRLTDAQLFVLLQANGVRVGLSFGKGAADVLETFRRNVRQNLDYIRSYVAENDLHSTYRFESIESGAAISTPLESGLEEGIPVWLEGVELNVVKHYDPETAILGGDGFVDEVNRVFSELYPIYLFAVSERPVQAAERYLARIGPEPTPRRYTDAQFLNDTYLEPRFLDELKQLVQLKKQIIFIGPPGTGKTYVAQKFAKLLAEGDEARVELIQFHPSYEYEESMEGIRPESKETGEGTQVVSYPVRAGAFKRFCEKARGSEDKWVMIIDEINRGNIAKIFGELLYLLEYRDSKVVLPYSAQSFSIPSNVFILGTMNTADRSIALVDFAMRRRFHFVHMPADRAVLERYLERNPGATRKALAYFDRANEAIDDPHYQIGFSYFMRPGLNESDIELIWRYSVFPYLQEYHFDDPDRLDQLTWEAVRDRVESRSGE